MSNESPDLSTLDREALARMVGELQEERRAAMRLLNPACTDETLEGAICNLQQAYVSERGNAEDAERLATTLEAQLTALRIRTAEAEAAHIETLNEGDRLRAELAQEVATSERVLMQNNSRWAQLVGKLAGENDGLRAALAQVGEKVKVEAVRVLEYQLQMTTENEASDEIQNGLETAIYVISNMNLAAIVAASAETAGANPACAMCGGPHPFDTVIPSVVWNQVIRARRLPEYLCLTCIVSEFAKGAQSFTAELWGKDFNGIKLEISINSQVANDAALLSEENTELRARLRAMDAAAEGQEAGDGK